MSQLFRVMGPGSCPDGVMGRPGNANDNDDDDYDDGEDDGNDDNDDDAR